MTENTPRDSVQALTDEIDRTREQLGETVEALAAKADVKARARDKAADLTGHVASAADQLREQAAARASQVCGGLAGKVTGARRTAAVAVAVAGITLAGWLFARRGRRERS